MLLFDFVNPYVIFMTIVFAFVFVIHAIFTKQEWIRAHKKQILLVATILVLWTQIARYIGIAFREDQYWEIGFLHFRIIAFDITTHLPFYICRLSVLVLLYYLLTKDKRVQSFLFYWGATGLAGIIYPNGEIANIATLTETFYIDHFILGVTPFFLVVYEGYRPVKKDLFVITGLMFAILLMFIPINQWMNAILGIDVATNPEQMVDYFYVARQSIFGDLFPGQHSLVFITVHTAVAFGFFSIYYRYFTRKNYTLRNGGAI